MRSILHNLTANQWAGLANAKSSLNQDRTSTKNRIEVANRIGAKLDIAAQC